MKYILRTISVIFAIASFLLVIYPGQVFVAAINSEYRFEEYISKSNEFVVIAPDMELYSDYIKDEMYKKENKYKIEKGTIIKPILPIELSEDNDYMKVIEEKDGKQTEAYFYKNYFRDNTTYEEEDFRVRHYKTFFAYMKMIVNDEEMVNYIFFIVLSLFFMNKIFDRLQLRDPKKKIVSISSFTFPTFLYFIINTLPMLKYEDEYDNMAKNGITLFGEGASIFSWIVYLTTISYLAWIIYKIVKLYMNYNPIIGVIKFISSYAILIMLILMIDMLNGLIFLLFAIFAVTNFYFWLTNPRRKKSLDTESSENMSQYLIREDNNGY